MFIKYITKLMARESASPQVKRIHELKHKQAVERMGWEGGYAYRARTEDPSFVATNEKCEICGEFHINPYEGNPYYVRIDRPLQIAKNWAKNHNIIAVVERREALIYRKLGKRTYARGTSVEEVELMPYSNWEIIKMIHP